MKVNLLQINWGTVQNLNIVINDISKKYNIPIEEFKKELNEKEIVLRLIGNTMCIPYHNVIYGNVISKNETGFGIKYKFDSVKYESLKIADIKQIILEAFDKEDKSVD